MPKKSVPSGSMRESDDGTMKISGTVAEGYFRKYTAVVDIPLDTDKGTVTLKVAGRIQLSPGDRVMARVKKSTRKKGEYTVVGHPFVEIPITKDNFIIIFNRWKRMSYSQLQCKTDCEDFYQATMKLVTEYLREETGKSPSGVGQIFATGSKYEIIELFQMFITRKDYETHPYAKFTGLITKPSFDAFMVFWNKEVNLRRLYVYGITDKMIMSSGYSVDELYTKVVQNPFTVAVIPLDVCHQLMETNGRVATYEQELCGGVLRFIYNALENGSSCCKFGHISKKSEYRNIINYLDVLASEYDVVMDGTDTLYIQRALYVEKEVCRFLDYTQRGLIYKFGKKGNPKTEHPTDPLEQLPIEYPDFLTNDQRDAVDMALDCTKPIVCITGGAGVGKSTLIKVFVDNLKRWGYIFGIFTFTGAASARVNSILGEQISVTFHRSFTQSAPDYDVIIIDESSMPNAELIYTFLHNNPTNKNRRWIFVGDWNQLPPIGWGRVFQVMVLSEKFPTYLLTGAHRSTPFKGKPDGIVPNAKSILNGDYIFTPSTNFFYNGNVSDTKEDMLAYFKTLHRGGAQAIECAVVCAYRKYDALDYFNKGLRKIFLTGKEKSVTDNAGKIWYVNDVVICIVNNMDRNVMNGERGIVYKVNDLKGKIYVRFSPMGGIEREIEFDTVFGKYREPVAGFESNVRGPGKMTTNDLEYGYSFTVHKAQGSEYKYGGFWVDHEGPEKARQWPGFLSRNLGYTAVTRCMVTCKVGGPRNMLENMSKQMLPFVTSKFTKRIQHMEHIERSFESVEEYDLD